MKERYAKPVVEMEEFKTADVITTSSETTTKIDQVGGADDD